MAPSDIPSPLHRQRTHLFLILAFFIVCRLILLVAAPHQDPSEARYAEISRKMMETGNWITPQHEYGVPFWAKPPLSMWMSAAGMKLFGANEFGSRIVIFIAAAGLLLLVYRFAKKEWSSREALTATVILMGMPLFFYCSAAVMTDLALLAGTTLAMISFRKAMEDGSKQWGYLFFIGLAMGLLAKGPLTWAIAGPPIAGWILLTGRWKEAWKKVPWLTGTLLMFAIAVPWYLLAEKKSPGFLDYFILGEHLGRFLQSKWPGDLYGKAHPQPIGMIWFFTVAGAFPWVLALLVLPFRRWRELGTWSKEKGGLGLYLILWAVWPVLFFTAARNIIATYPLPALPALALLLGCIIPAFSTGFTRKVIPALSMIIVAAATLISTLTPQFAPKSSERALVEQYLSQRGKGDALVYYGRRKYSAEFYSFGKATNTRSPEELERLLALPGTLYVATDSEHYRSLPYPIQHRLRLLASFGKQSALYRENTPAPFSAASN